MRQDWRTSINRFAEAMTLFAVACAGMFPLLHLGRPWVFYWLFPYPNTMALAAVPQPAGVGCVRGQHLRHGLAALLVRRPDPRPGDAARPRQAPIGRGSSTACSPWAGAARHATGSAIRPPTCCWPAWPRRWSSRCTASWAWTSPPAIVPGWHSTIFPPYFVAGAIFSGFAMVLTLAIPLRDVLRPAGFHHHPAHRQLRQADARHRPDRRLRLRASKRSWAGTAATPTSCS